VKWILDIGVGEKPRGNVNIDVVKTSYCNVVADAQTLPFKNDSIDKILCSQTLEHLRQPVKALKEINRVLKPNGTAEIDFPKPNFTNNMKYRFVEFVLNLPFSMLHFKVLFQSIKGVKQKNPRWYHKHVITTKNIARELKIIETREFGNLLFKSLHFGKKSKVFRFLPQPSIFNTGVWVKCCKKK